jgi:hypothetical protein
MSSPSKLWERGKVGSAVCTDVIWGSHTYLDAAAQAIQLRKHGELQVVGLTTSESVHPPVTPACVNIIM